MEQNSNTFMEEEESSQFIINNIQSHIYYKFINCLFIHKIDQRVLDDQFNVFCEKYKIQNHTELYSLFIFVKEETTHLYDKFTVDDPILIGNLFMFVIYYMKMNSLFAYMNRVLYLMMATNKMRLSIKGCSFDEESKDFEMKTNDLIEETIDNQLRVEKLLELNKKIENISKQMNFDYVYKIESNVYHDYDGDVLNFGLVA
uniref:Uncharacterized protein n=1 Tax=viral metagenome TaxID=1070528 RepID=A0A6C0BWW0_9ZZZZ